MLYLARPNATALRPASVVALGRLFFDRGFSGTDALGEEREDVLFLKRLLPGVPLPIRPAGASLREWFEWLARQGVEDLVLGARPSVTRRRGRDGLRSLVILTNSERRSTCWRPSLLYRAWSARWLLIYREVGAVALADTRDVKGATSELKSAVGRVMRFLVSPRAAEIWPEQRMYITSQFERASALLSGGSLGAPVATSLLPAVGYDRAAQCLAAACEAAWVFGGQGSWNDLDSGVMETEEYSELSHQLRTAVLGGLAAAVNSPI